MADSGAIRVSSPEEAGKSQHTMPRHPGVLIRLCHSPAGQLQVEQFHGA